MKLTLILLELDSNEIHKLLKLNALRFGRNTDLYRLKERSTSTDVIGVNFIHAMFNAISV